MAILALEFSSLLRSVSVFAGDGVTARACEKGARETKPFTLIEAALREAGVGRDAVDGIAVGLGPGSYAGVRIAIAIAQGWRLARGTKLLGFSSADCVAHQFAGEGAFTVVVDAQRNEFYGARYEKKGVAIKLVEPFRLMTEQDWQRRKNGEPFFRPDVLEDGDAWRALPPDSMTLAHFAAGTFSPVAELPLESIYLRPATFLKAQPPRFTSL